MRWALAVVVLVAACSTPEPPPPTPSPTSSTTAPPSTAGTPLPVVLTGKDPDVLTGEMINELEPDVPATAPIRDRVIGRIRRETLSSAGVPGTVTASCGNIPTPAEKGVTTCTAAWNGVAVQWSVVATASAGSEFFTDYTILPAKILLTKRLIYHNFYVKHHQVSNDVERCQEIPDVVLVDTPGFDGHDTGYRCQVLTVPKDNVRTWKDLRLIVNSEGEILWRD